MLFASYWPPVILGCVLGVVIGGLVGLLKLKYGRNGRGVRLLSAGRYEEAERLFTEIIDRVNTRSLAYRSALLNRSVARIDAGRPREGLADLEAAGALLKPKARVMRAAWLFNHAYCRVLLVELDGVPGEIAEMEAMNARGLRAHTNRLRILYAARQGRFHDAATIATVDARDGPHEVVPRAQRLAYTLHAFVLSQLPTDDERRGDVDALIQKAKAIEAPTPTGMGVHWPAWSEFLSENALG